LTTTRDPTSRASPFDHHRSSTDAHPNQRRARPSEEDIVAANVFGLSAEFPYVQTV
jgi:hypothetical protein